MATNKSQKRRPQVQVSLSLDDQKRLKALADKRKLAVSALCRSVIVQYLDSIDEDDTFWSPKTQALLKKLERT